jgi:hypothetical protein
MKLMEMIKNKKFANAKMIEPPCLEQKLKCAYKMGYFFGKHPYLEKVKKEMEGNSISVLIATLGLTVSALGILKILTRIFSKSK